MAVVPEDYKIFVENAMPLTRHMGIKVREIRPRYVELLMPLEGNTNHIGTMYAGALFVLAEMTGGVMYLTTFDTSRFYPIVKELTIKFKRPVMTAAIVKVSMTPEQVEAVSEEANANNKADYILEGEIFDESGQLVAESHAVYQLRAMGT